MLQVENNPMATATQSIREIISSQPTAAAILLRFDIDVCAQANETLTEACSDLQLSVEQVLEKLNDGAALGSGAQHSDPAGYTASRLIQHIVRNHHHDVRQELPKLAEMAHTVAEKYAARAPELNLIAQRVDDLRINLAEHIRKEEQVLFPYIAQVEQAPLLAFRPPQNCFTTVGQPVFMMVQEHEQAKLLLAELRQLTGDFKPPVWACSTFVAFYSGLRTFADSFEEHIRLEDEILFPRAIEMEKALTAAGVQ
jgi:regulator of cell morphogenesis and NO signaling